MGFSRAVRDLRYAPSFTYQISVESVNGLPPPPLYIPPTPSPTPNPALSSSLSLNILTGTPPFGRIVISAAGWTSCPACVFVQRKRVTSWHSTAFISMRAIWRPMQACGPAAKDMREALAWPYESEGEGEPLGEPEPELEDGG